ncbi:TPA: hypothetical protein ACJRXN_000930 [Streptococcus agalactiae]
MVKKQRIYAIYDDDKFVDVGTKEELSARLVGYEWGKDNLSVFGRWQLEQANMYLDVIEWIEELTNETSI